MAPMARRKLTFRQSNQTMAVTGGWRPIRSLACLRSKAIYIWNRKKTLIGRVHSCCHRVGNLQRAAHL